MAESIERTAFPAYVGITGYTDSSQARAVHASAAALLESRVLMDGYLLWAHDFDSRWAGEGDAPANLGNRFLSTESAEAIFREPSHGSLRFVHFRTQRFDRLGEQLQSVMDRLGHGVDGFQLNWIPQPSPTELSDFKHSQDQVRRSLGLPDLALVLQLHPDVLRAAGDNDDFLVKYVEPFVALDAITHLLYDPSGGLGASFDPQRALSAIDRLSKEFPNLSLGVAGGLSAENVATLVTPIWRSHPQVNIDVEGRVRDEATDALSLDKAIAYVNSALTLAGVVT